jgi:hypothetical protein
MVNKEEALEILDQITDCLHCPPEGTYEALDLIAKIVRQQTEPPWIPVTERLPKLGEIVLWCNEDERVFSSAITAKNKDIYYVGKHGYIGKHGNIIAWMPLPVSYKPNII